MIYDPAEPIYVCDIEELVNKVFPKALKPINIQEEFSSTGIWPANLNVLSDSDFLAFYVFVRHTSNISV